MANNLKEWDDSSLPKIKFIKGLSVEIHQCLRLQMFVTVATPVTFFFKKNTPVSLTQQNKIIERLI